MSYLTFGLNYLHQKVKLQESKLINLVSIRQRYVNALLSNYYSNTFCINLVDFIQLFVCLLLSLSLGTTVCTKKVQIVKNRHHGNPRQEHQNWTKYPKQKRKSRVEKPVSDGVENRAPVEKIRKILRGQHGRRF